MLTMTAATILLLLQCLSNAPELCREATLAAKAEPGAERYIALAETVMSRERIAQ
ncbi:hypothetical protein [uncultured Amaricoccus sp.]|uniref:hypothetical protein n=1 Tax=uncultured Amaricoccus sp. TaxID=339341 RepID=UPI00260DDD19|nr:hypothetical protein [uncultured Amaricoccus sp.]